LDVIGGKWKGVVLYQLISGAKGFNELKKKFPELSQRELSRQLQELERQRVVDREVLPGKPARTRYSLADLGFALIPILQGLKSWGDRLLVTRAGKTTRRLRHAAK
jgi:DNA-binding HxlR family transcriptional regulator